MADTTTTPTTPAPIQPGDTNPQNPDGSYNTYLGSGTTNTIAKQGAQAADPSVYQNEIMNGVNQTGSGLLRSTAQTNQSTQSLGMNTPDDYAQSLGTRTAQNYKSTVDALNTNAKINAPTYQMSLLGQQAGNLAGVENLKLASYKMANQQYEQQVQMDIAQQAANNSVFSSVLGLAGTVLGLGIAALVPGAGIAALAAGAAIGGGVGGAAGKAAGGTAPH